ncbi:helix-turn-helix domain-containing protein, partial [Paraglaciecola arctica]
MADINHNLLTGGLIQGQADRRIRTELYLMSQTQYAVFIDLSAKTLWDIEKGNTDPILSVLSKVFRPAGMNIIAQAE